MSAIGFASTAIIAGAETQKTGANPVADASGPIADVACKLQQGETFSYSIRSRHVRQHQKPDESIIKWITRRTVVVSCEVIEPDPELGPRVRVTFDELNVTLLTPSKALRFTSENDHMNVVGSAMTLAMEPIVGASITLTLDATGRILKVDGADKLLKEKELRKYAEHIVGEEAIDLMIGPIFRSVAQPSGESGGEPWTSSRELDFPEFATFHYDERWEFSKRRAGRVTFKGESDTTAMIDERWPKGVMTNSRTIGSYTWAELTGRLHRTEINRFYIVELENDPDGPSIAGEEVLTISAPIIRD